MTTVDVSREVFQPVIDRDPYVAGVHVVARRFDALVQSRMGGEIEIMAQAERVPIGELDVRAVVEDALYFAHSEPIDDAKVDSLISLYLDGYDGDETMAVIGRNAPCTLRNLNALATLAILDTDPDSSRADERRALFESFEGTEVRNPIAIDREDTLLEEVEPILTEAFVRVLPKTFFPPEGQKLTRQELIDLREAFEDTKDAELRAITAHGMARGLLREEVRNIRAQAKIAVTN